MKRFAVVLCLFALAVPTASFGQGALAIRSARSLVEQIGVRGGKTASEEVVRLGGEKAVQEVLEKAAKEGGEVLVEKTARYSVEYGPIVLRGAKDSPLRFISAFEKLSPSLRTGAVQGMRREPELMTRLIGEYGETALEVAARHPGAGPSVLSKIGRESSEFLVSHPTDHVIRVARLSDDIAKASPAQRRDLMLLISRAPEKTLNLLETHPKVLMTGAALTAFLAAKDQILGTEEIVIGPDGKPVTIGKTSALRGVVKELGNIVKDPLAIFAAVAGVIIALVALIKLLPLLRFRNKQQSS
jgi:hypothetical protein